MSSPFVKKRITVDRPCIQTHSINSNQIRLVHFTAYAINPLALINLQNVSVELNKDASIQRDYELILDVELH